MDNECDVDMRNEYPYHTHIHIDINIYNRYGCLYMHMCKGGHRPIIVLCHFFACKLQGACTLEVSGKRSGTCTCK